MVKSMRREQKKSRKNIKRVSLKKKHRAHKKYGGSGKKSMNRRNQNSSKSNKIFSLKKKHIAHKKYVDFHHSRGLHNRGRVRYGGKKMRGGMVSSPASGPVGYSWQGGNEATWPGVAASHGINTSGTTMSNHFAVSPNGIAVGGIELARSTTDDFNITPPMGGGRSRKRNGNKQNGGFFQEIVNLGRGAQYGVNGGYFDLIGKQQPLSQNPFSTEQPINSSSGAIQNLTLPPDVRQIYIDANNNVAKA
jgi:hypothetical protein